MKYYKTIEDGIITMIGSGSAIHETQTEITKEEYDSLMDTILNKPVDTWESVYFLAESGVYEPRERTEEEKVEWYLQLVLADEIYLEEVPMMYRAEVASRLPISEEEQWANEIMEEVSGYEY